MILKAVLLLIAVVDWEDVAGFGPKENVGVVVGAVLALVSAGFAKKFGIDDPGGFWVAAFAILAGCDVDGWPNGDRAGGAADGVGAGLGCLGCCGGGKGKAEVFCCSELDGSLVGGMTVIVGV